MGTCLYGQGYYRGIESFVSKQRLPSLLFCQHVRRRERLNEGPCNFQALQRFHESNVLAAKIAEVFRPKVRAWASLRLCHGMHAVQKHGCYLLIGYNIICISCVITSVCIVIHNKII